MCKDDGICDYCNSNKNGDTCSNPNCGTRIFRGRVQDKLQAIRSYVETYAGDGGIDGDHVAWLLEATREET